MKIAFGMIVFESDYVLKQCLEQIYPFASQILIAEGPVEYWQQKGRETSLDGTNASEYTYSYQHQKLYVMIPTQSTIDNAKQKKECL